MKNLDLAAARAAQTMVADDFRPQELDNLVTKALGVVQESGVYAGTLFLCSRSREEEKKMAKAVRKTLLGLAGELGVAGMGNGADTRQTLRDVAERVCRDSGTMLLVKQVWEQALVYARYGAKAKKEG